MSEGGFAVKEYSPEGALTLAACAEKFSSHPIAAAFKDVETEYVAERADEVAGRGVPSTVDGKTLL